MEKIIQHNCDGLCIQKTCSKKEAYFTNQEICGIKLHLAFCKEHAKEFEDNFIKNDGLYVSA